jgi:hypothetical protein
VTPTGTVAFYVCGPDAPTPCTATDGTELGTGAAVSGATSDSGDTVTATSPAFRATATGSYCFLAVYSGDADYASTPGAANDDECFTVNAAPPAPLALGGAENSFGTGALSLGVGAPTDIWAAVNGYCTSKENGDEFLSAFDGTWNGQNWICAADDTAASPDATANDEYDPTGYSYDIVTPGSTGTLAAPLTVQAYDPSYEPSQCPAESTGPFDPDGGQTADVALDTNTAITTSYALAYAPVPGDATDDEPVSGASPYVAASGDPTTCGQWVTLFTIPTGSPDGYYRLHVSTSAGEADSDGVNAYSLRAFAGESFARCSSVTTAAWYSPACPVIQGQSALSVFANKSGNTGTFSLAQIPAADAGGTMDVNLFDPGEGDNDIELLNPDGVAVPFTWRTTDSCPLAAPNALSTDCAEDLGLAALNGAGTDLDVSGAVTPPPGERSNSVFNDREVQLAVAIPADYSADNGGWWSVKYISNDGTVQDRTTWTVTVTPPPAVGGDSTSARSLLRGRTHAVAKKKSSAGQKKSSAGQKKSSAGQKTNAGTAAKKARRSTGTAGTAGSETMPVLGT